MRARARARVRVRARALARARARVRARSRARARAYTCAQVVVKTRLNKTLKVVTNHAFLNRQKRS